MKSIDSPIAMNTRHWIKLLIEGNDKINATTTYAELGKAFNLTPATAKDNVDELLKRELLTKDMVSRVLRRSATTNDIPDK